MPNYDIFARYYDPIMGDSKDTAELIQSLIEEYSPHAKTVLELAVGTASVLYALKDKYSLAGLDLSKEMLKVAKKKVPKAELYAGDMANFSLGKKYDVIFCVFDSINHLDKFSDWVRMFQSTAKHLNKNGLFIFDMNTVSRLKKLAYTSEYEQLFSGGRLIMEVKPLKKTTYEWRVSIYDENEDAWYEEHINESSFPLSKVREALNDKFTLLSWFDAFSEEPDENSDRVFYVCKKS